ncbi:unnamed protein product, partial [Pylaiella littoralis]
CFFCFLLLCLLPLHVCVLALPEIADGPVKRVSCNTGGQTGTLRDVGGHPQPQEIVEMVRRAIPTSNSDCRASCTRTILFYFYHLPLLPPLPRLPVLPIFFSLFVPLLPLCL